MSSSDLPSGLGATSTPAMHPRLDAVGEAQIDASRAATQAQTEASPAAMQVQTDASSVATLSAMMHAHMDPMASQVAQVTAQFSVLLAPSR